jgi:DNA-binding transcriptional ArsR family regulator
MFREHVPVPGAGHMRVELDKKSILALASDTRLEILKSLQPMRRTVSQLSEAVNIDKAAVHRHLKKMEEGGLVKRYEEHGFVYYGLSWKARDLLTPNENTKIVILLSVTWLLLLVALLFLSAGLMAERGNDYLYRLLPATGAEHQQGYDTLPSADELSWIGWALPSIVFGAAAAVPAVISLRRIRRPFQGAPRDSEGAQGSEQPPADGMD